MCIAFRVSRGVVTVERYALTRTGIVACFVATDDDKKAHSSYVTPMESLQGVQHHPIQVL